MNVRLLAIVCCLCAFLFTTFLIFKTSAQPQNSADPQANASPMASPAPSPLSAPSPTPIPLSHIIGEKDKTEERLLEISRKISEQSPVFRLQDDLSELVKDLAAREQEANELLAATPSLETLDKIENYWTSLSLSLPSRKNRVQTQAAEFSSQLTELQNIQTIWSVTAQALESDSVEARKETAPEAPPSDSAANTPENRLAGRNANTAANAKVETNRNVNSNAAASNLSSAEPANPSIPELPGNLRAQIDEIIEKIRQTQSAVQTNLGELIKLQESLAENERRTNDMLGKIASARNVLLSNLVVRDAPPIWSRDSFERGFRQGIKKSFSTKFSELKVYFFEHRVLFLLHSLIVLALILAFRRARRKTRQLVETEPKLKNGLIIFEFPLASALILGLFFGPLLYMQAPDLLGVIASPVFVGAIFLLFRRLIEKPYTPILIALVALYLVNDLRLLTAPFPLLSRLIFLAVTLSGIVFLAWLIRSNSRPENLAVSESNYSKAIRNVSAVLLLPFVAAFLANALGFVSLAGVIGKAIVSSLSLGLILYALVRVADSLLIFVFRIPPFSGLRMVKNHRSLLQTKISGVLKWLAIVLWVVVALTQAYLFTPIIELIGKILTFQIGTGSFAVSLSGILLVVFIIWFAFLLSRFIRFALEEDVYPRVKLASGLPYAASTILHYLLLLGGVFLGLAAAGVDLTKFTIFLGALGVGVGIGLQKIVENFISGLILLLERPVKVGDSIQMDEHQGELKRIGLRASVVKTFDGAEIIVPNGQLITKEVTNWTLSDHRRRLDINVGVEYGADPEQVIALLEKVGKDHPETDKELSPRALFIGFGDNSLDFQLRAWTANQENWVFIKSDLTLGIYKKLKEAGIQIPFPQRDLHIKTIDEDVLDKINRTR